MTRVSFTPAPSLVAMPRADLITGRELDVEAEPVLLEVTVVLVL